MGDPCGRPVGCGGAGHPLMNRFRSRLWACPRPGDGRSLHRSAAGRGVDRQTHKAECSYCSSYRPSPLIRTIHLFAVLTDRQRLRNLPYFGVRMECHVRLHSFTVVRHWYIDVAWGNFTLPRARNFLNVEALPVHDDARDVFMALPRHTCTREDDVQPVMSGAMRHPTQAWGLMGAQRISLGCTRRKTQER